MVICVMRDLVFMGGGSGSVCGRPLYKVTVYISCQKPCRNGCGMINHVIVVIDRTMSQCVVRSENFHVGITPNV